MDKLIDKKLNAYEDSEGRRYILRRDGSKMYLSSSTSRAATVEEWKSSTSDQWAAIVGHRCPIYTVTANSAEQAAKVIEQELNSRGEFYKLTAWVNGGRQVAMA